LLILMTSIPPPVSAESVIPSGYRSVAETHGIPSALFYAVALAESGTRVDALGAMRPWPWTLNVQGDGRFYPSRRAATLAFEDALATGRTSVDVGLMQVSWRYHRRALGHVAGALDPYRNLDVAAAILTACHEMHRDWWAAVGCYHAPNDPARAERYSHRVKRLWRGLRVQQ
jgi:soluble lytic murein transglycosylase-like protein